MRLSRRTVFATIRRGGLAVTATWLKGSVEPDHPWEALEIMEPHSRNFIIGAASLVALALACGSSPPSPPAPSPSTEPPIVSPPPSSSSAPNGAPSLAVTTEPWRAAESCGLKRTDVKGSAIFCGNVRLYEDDETSLPWEGKPNTAAGAIRNEAGRAVCMSPETVLVPSPATQNFEIRGWVTRDFLPMSQEYTAEEEYFVEVALDLDWTPQPAEPGEPPLIRLHSMADLLKYIPATNIMKFGGRQIAGTGDTWGGGGPAQVIIHVEIDSWGPSRGKKAYRKLGPPPGWDQAGTEGVDPVYFHRDILKGDRIASNGDYVRVIGTQWRDDSHLNPLDPSDPKLCWAQHVPNGDYWAEMHTADKIEKLPPPPGRTRNDLIAYAACSTTPLSLSESVALQPPSPNDQIVKVIPAIWSASVATFAAPTFDARSVTFDIQSSGPALAFYRVIWSSCVPSCNERCGGSDGCGGVCPTRACAPTRVCDQDGACSCPAGFTLCPDRCQPLAATP